MSATRSSPPVWRTPSSSITVQKGQATASVSAPVAAASRTRSSLIWFPRSSIHMCAPPAPQQKVRFPDLRHLEGPPDPRDDVARRVEHVVVAREVARVVVRDRRLAAGRRQAAPVDQVGEQLRVMDDLVAAAEVRVLVRERVEAVRAARDDLRHARAVERLDIRPARTTGRGTRSQLASPDRRCTTRVGRGSRRRARLRASASSSRSPPNALARRTPRRNRPSRGTPGVGHPARGRGLRGRPPRTLARPAACPTGSRLARRRAASTRRRPEAAIRP